MRQGQVNRETAETKIHCQLDLEGQKESHIQTGIGFFDHMLTLLTFHAGFQLELVAEGDLEVCDHHTVEDCGIVLGQAMNQALGDRRGLARYGSFTLPMDETLCNVTLDFSGRPYLVYHCELKREQIGNFSCEMAAEFLRAFAFGCGLTLHVNVYYGSNDHHKIEAIFKALGRALKEALRVEGDRIASSKGTLV